MATVHRYVNTASSGGNGTTTALSGANAAYASLAAWNAAEVTNLVTAGNIHHVHCAGAAETVAANTTISLTGWTTDAANYIIIEVDPADRSTLGKLDTSKYHLSKTSTGTTADIIDAARGTKFRGLQFYFRENNGATAARDCIQIASGAYNIEVSDCIFDIGGNDDASAPNCIFMTAASAAEDNYFFNNLFILNYTGAAASAGYAVSNTLGSMGDCAYFYNNTFIDVSGKATAAVNVDAFTGGVFVNNIFQGFGTDFLVNTGNITGSDYNLTDNGSLPVGSNNQVSTTLTFAGSGSYKLASSDTAAIGTGLDDPGAGLFTKDALGVTRTDWGIGAFEYVSGGALSITSVSPTQIDSGESVTITGTGFGATQGSSFVKIGTVTQTVTAWSDTSITITSNRDTQSMGATTLTVVKV